MRMMHESRLWVVHLMIKVLRIRLLEVLVVHLRHRVEETVVIVLPCGFWSENGVDWIQRF